ncbi:MAG: hypothetical protein ABEJ22_02785 [Haloferacaceae archaeon]
MSLLVSRTGALVLVVYGLVSLAYLPTSNGLMKTVFERQGIPVSEAGLVTYDAPLWVYSVAFVVLLVALTYVGILAVRVFVAGERDTIPSAFYTRNIVRVFVNYVVGGLVFSIVLVLGTLLLVVPGIVAYVSFVFMVMFVAAEDENFVAALRHSWKLASGERLRIFALLVVLFVGMALVGGVVTMGLSILSVAGVLSRGAASIVTSLVYMPLTLYFLAVVAAAYNQLRDEADAADDSEWEFGVDELADGSD